MLNAASPTKNRLQVERLEEEEMEQDKETQILEVEEPGCASRILLGSNIPGRRF